CLEAREMNRRSEEMRAEMAGYFVKSPNGGKQHEVGGASPFERSRAAAGDQTRGLNDVLRQIRADRGWGKRRGKGVHIAIIDTGICGQMREFPEWKRSRFSTDRFGNPWGDVSCHGSMVACVAAGTSSEGGRYDGVAPDATLISCRVPFGDFN